MKKRLKALISLTFATFFSFPSPSELQPANAQVFEGFVGCPAGTREGAVNYVINGNFATLAGTGDGVYTPAAPVPPNLGFVSDLPYRGDSVYPDDPIGGLSIQNGPYPISYFNGVVQATPFPGDPVNGVAATNNFLYSNPGQRVGGGSAFPNPIIWQQRIAGLAPNTSYNFSAYFYNLLAPTSPGEPPRIRFLSGPLPGQPGAFVPPLPGQAVNERQRWIRVQGLFRTNAGQTGLELQIVDEANTVLGDDFGMTAVGLRECVPVLGVAKNAGTPTRNQDGTFTIPYTITVRNYAPVGNSQYDLLNLQLTDDLATAFAGATINSVTNIQSATLTVNPGFNGSTNQNLLQAGSTLIAGATAIVTFNVTITPGSGPNRFGPFNNTTIANAVSRGGTNLSDRSTNGTNPDPDNNGNPADNGTPTPVILIPNSGGGVTTPPSLRLVKRVTNVLRGNAPLSGVNFSGFEDAPGADDNAPAWAQLTPQRAPIGVSNLGANNPVTSGDEIEYTIYFLSDGSAPASAVNICDAIPANTRFINGSNVISRSNGTPTPGGAYFSPLAPLPPNNPCQDQNNQNGSIIFDVGTVSNSPGDNVGFARFRVRVD